MWTHVRRLRNTDEAKKGREMGNELIDDWC